MPTVAQALLAPLAIAALIGTHLAQADEVEDFYRGKTVTIIVSNPPGGGYDLLARTIAPTSPSISRQAQRDRAEHARRGRYPRHQPHFHHRAERRDHYRRHLQHRAVRALLGTAEARFDPLAFNWLGSPTVETGLLGVWHTVPVYSIDDAKTREVTIGANGPHSTPSFYARLLNETLGTKLKLVMGYPGQNEFDLAIEKGEVDGTSSLFTVRWWDAAVLAAREENQASWCNTASRSIPNCQTCRSRPILPTTPTITPDAGRIRGLGRGTALCDAAGGARARVRADAGCDDDRLSRIRISSSEWKACSSRLPPPRPAINCAKSSHAPMRCRRRSKPG